MFEELMAQSKLGDLERAYRESRALAAWRELSTGAVSPALERRLQALLTDLYGPGRHAEVDPGLFSRLVWNGLDCG